VRVTVLNNVLFPTDGKPIRAIRASPDLTTSKPSPYKNKENLFVFFFRVFSYIEPCQHHSLHHLQVMLDEILLI
jgi:hypothetical protein